MLSIKNITDKFKKLISDKSTVYKVLSNPILLCLLLTIIILLVDFVYSCNKIDMRDGIDKVSFYGKKLLFFLLAIFVIVFMYVYVSNTRQKVQASNTIQEDIFNSSNGAGENIVKIEPQSYKEQAQRTRSRYEPEKTRPYNELDHISLSDNVIIDSPKIDSNANDYFIT